MKHPLSLTQDNHRQHTIPSPGYRLIKGEAAAGGSKEEE